MTDDLSGLSSVSVHGSRPTGIHGFGANIWDVNGDIWSGTILIPAHAEPGTWSIDVYAHDVAGNEAARYDVASVVVSAEVMPALNTTGISLLIFLLAGLGIRGLLRRRSSS